MDAITVYGADWCEDTQETRQHLDALGVAYHYINVEQDPQAQAWVKQQNHGKQKTPTVDFGGKKILVEPSNDELDEALRGRGVTGD